MHPKGVLIVNAYREISPSERTEAPFPHQMLSYSHVRKHCLITTTQLLSIFLEIQGTYLSRIQKQVGYF